MRRTLIVRHVIIAVRGQEKEEAQGANASELAKRFQLVMMVTAIVISLMELL